MATKKEGPSFDEILKEIQGGKFRQTYLLMGAENYYIDRIVDSIVEHALTEDERDFNLHTFYGTEASINDIINTARSFPMGAGRTVVLVKEAQSVQGLENLSYYLQHPQPTTVLVIVYKSDKIDRRRKYVSMIAASGLIFDSKKPTDRELPALIRGYVKQGGRTIDEKSVSLIADSIGPDLSRLYGELDKLFIAMPATERAITPEVVERNIGISKDFNYFELQNAIVARDARKAFQIVKYFGENQKANPVQATLTMLFRFFSTLMTAYYAPNRRNSSELAAHLGMQEWQVRVNVLPAMRNYSGRKVYEILNEIKSAEEKSKGIGGSNLSGGDILRQLVCSIFE